MSFLKWCTLNFWKDLRYQKFENILRLFSACQTIGGPDPYQRCIFPFIWNGQKYYGCPVDPYNNAVRWCSTAVDRYGYHVIGQGRYGYCDNSCPDHRPLSPNSGRATFHPNQDEPVRFLGVSDNPGNLIIFHVCSIYS